MNYLEACAKLGLVLNEMTDMPPDQQMYALMGAATLTIHRHYAAPAWDDAANQFGILLMRAVRDRELVVRSLEVSP